MSTNKNNIFAAAASDGMFKQTSKPLEVNKRFNSVKKLQNTVVFVLDLAIGLKIIAVLFKLEFVFNSSLSVGNTIGSKFRPVLNVFWRL
jgi:hypothetical protein